MKFLKLFITTDPKPRMIWGLHSIAVESQVAGIQVEQKVQVRKIFQYPSKDRCWEGITVCLSSYTSLLSSSHAEMHWQGIVIEEPEYPVHLEMP